MWLKATNGWPAAAQPPQRWPCIMHNPQATSILERASEPPPGTGGTCSLEGPLPPVLPVTTAERQRTGMGVPR